MYLYPSPAFYLFNLFPLLSCRSSNALWNGGSFLPATPLPFVCLKRIRPHCSAARPANLPQDQLESGFISQNQKIKRKPECVFLLMCVCVRVCVTACGGARWCVSLCVLVYVTYLGPFVVYLVIS